MLKTQQANEVAAKRAAIKDKLSERESALAQMRHRLNQKKGSFEGEELLRGDAVSDDISLFLLFSLLNTHFHSLQLIPPLSFSSPPAVTFLLSICCS
jgi:hypothetical protein